MKRTAIVRFLAAAAVAALVLLASGCGRLAASATGSPPKIRIEGARILETDPEMYAAEPPSAAEAPPAEPARAAPPPPGAVPPGAAPGVTVSLDVIDARAADVLRGLAYQGSVNLILASGPDRRVTIHLQEAPWAEAFHAVLQGADLVAEWEGNRARVLSAEQLRTEREAAERLARQRPETQVVPLQSLLAKEAAPVLTSMLSEGGRIGADDERNALLVTDTPARIEAIRTALRDLDRTPAQVMIEAIIVDVTLNDELHSGVDWSILRQGGKAITLKQALTVGAGTNPATNPGASLGFTLTSGDWTLSAVIDMLQKQDNVKILANPRVLAVNNRRARIEIIEEIPYQELTQTQQGGQIGTTSFKEVGVKLEVTPRIAADGNVHLQLMAEQSAPTQATINQIPVVQTRRSETVMTVHDGQVIAIGGLRRHHSTTNQRKVPAAGDWPILGLLFRRVETVDTETELVVFIRPKVIRPGQTLTARQRTLAEAIDHVDRRPQIVRTDPLRLHVAEEDARDRTVPAGPPKSPTQAQKPPEAGTGRAGSKP
jgi:type IV pilus secretin PilQ/predicted competence protein